MQPGRDPKNIVGSIVKASRLLDLYSTSRRTASLSDFIRETGYNKTTAYRLLQTLVATGWLVRSDVGVYRLGVRLLVLGAIARADLDLRNDALPALQKLADEFGDTAFLMVPGPQGAVTIEAIVGASPVRVHGLSVGSVLPYYVAAGPVVLAAFTPSIEAEVLQQEHARFTESTLIAESALRARFAEVREHGYALSIEDYIDDVAAVAAPVLAPDGTALASVSLGGPAHRFTKEMRTAAIERVVQYARDLSLKLNY